MSEFEQQHQSGVKEKRELKPPPMYKVILNNDDYTPMDFVVEILIRFFRMNSEQATDVMLQIHYKGKAVCGVFQQKWLKPK